jgi:hypothetical protein
MATPTRSNVQKFSVEKLASGGVTTLTLHGVIDEGFDGQKVAETAKTDRLVVSMRDVRRFASWGMAEWMNFLRATAQQDLYFIECSSYAMSQMNLVTGLVGHAKVVSFYSAFRCGSCSEEFELLTLVPQDRGAIRELASTEKICPTCGGNARMDKFAVAMCTALADKPPYEMDDDVAAMLRSQFQYTIAPDLTRFRAFRRATKGAAYLRLSGNTATLPSAAIANACEATTVVDLGAVLYDPALLEPWRAFIQTALPRVTSLQLLDCPPGFFEAAITAEDLSAKLAIRTFASLYECSNCHAITAHMIDVAANLEQLIQGVMPSRPCATCQSPVQPIPRDAAMLQRLPARPNDAALEKFVARARLEPTDKLDDVIAMARSAKATPAAQGPKINRIVYIAAGLAALVVIALIVMAISLWKTRSAVPEVVADNAASTAPGTQKEGFHRPDWIVSDVPSSAFCRDMINRLVCVGVSSYREKREDGLVEATDAALEELVNTVGLKIDAPYVKDTVLRSYSDARTKAIAALQAVDTDRRSPAYRDADAAVRAARKRVTGVLQASGGPAVPAQRADWYWEEYAKEKATGTELLVFVRYDISFDAVKTLVTTYSSPVVSGGTGAVTAFPGLAWEYPDFTGGAMITQVGKAIAPSGLTPGAIVTAANGQPVVDAPSFAKKLEAPGALVVQVKVGAAAAKSVPLRR